jgi:alkanesulfonate monooxygenase SsuD/methylene tetrahydromethanopterin reductase-like flavin-dependent oxidoreductase (luciferase family)
MTWAMPPRHVAASRARLGPDKAINAQMVCIFEEDAAVARETARKYLTIWLAIPSYRKAWMESGFAEADLADGGSDALIDAIAAWGSPERIAEKIAEYHGAGASRVIVEPVRLRKAEFIHPLTGPMYVESDFESLERLAPLLPKA